MNVTVLIPERLLNPSDISNALKGSAFSSNNDAPVALVVLRVRPARVLWRALGPLLLEADARIARFALQYILQHHVKWENVGKVIPSTLFQGDDNQSTKGTCVEVGESSSTSTIPWVQRRRIKNVVVDTRCSRQFREVILWIETPTVRQPVEDAFMGRLIALEHKLIRAQSLTGYVATLGGGFFLCRHFKTAIALAQQQQKLALLLNDYPMYYRCMVNAAYNYVYAGQFRVANQMIRYAWENAKNLTTPDPALMKMCYSAMLFSRRVKRALKSYDESRGLPPSDFKTKTFDDYARIRVVPDQSFKTDLSIPFGDRYEIVYNYSTCN